MEEENKSDPKRSKRFKSIAIVLFLLILITTTFFSIFGFGKKQTDQEKLSLVSENEVPSWKFYKQDTLGLSFYHPPEWGNVRQEINYITNLKTLKKGCDGQYDIDDRCNSINLGFENLNYYYFLQFRIFNDAYKGEKYPNSYASIYDPIENIPVLVNTKDVCKYKINFDTPYKDKKREIYTYCKDDIKVSLIETIQDFRGSSFNPPIGILYTYDLKYFSYKKLKNGVFDNLLISKNVSLSTSTSQLKSSLTSEQFFEKVNIDPLSNEQLHEFKKFLNSFNIYTPPKYNEQDPVLIQEDEDNVSLIRKYYALLLNQPSEAYKLIKSDLDLSQFVEKYLNNLYKANPRDFKNLGENTYEYWLDYQEHNKKLEVQRHIVKIDNNKITPNLSEILTSEIAEADKKIAYGSSRGNESLMILTEAGQETKINSAPNNFDENIGTLIFRNPQFSKTGKYLLYDAGGWEWSFSYVYDTENKKQLHKEDSGYSGLNSNENLYYYCSSNDFGGNYSATVYEVPTFKIKTDLSQIFPDLIKFGTSINCKENISNSTIEFEFKGRYLEDNTYDENFSKLIKVDAKTGQILNEKQP